MTIPERGHNHLIETVSCPQPKFLLSIVENVDRTGFSVGKLGRLGDDCVKTVSRSTVELTAC